MRSVGIVLGIALALVTWSAAPAAAAPIEPFVIVGTATPLGAFGVDPGVHFDAVVTWDGEHMFTVVLHEQATGLPVHANSFHGSVAQGGIHVDGCEEHTGFDGLSELPPEAVLQLFGEQINNLCDGGVSVNSAGIYLAVLWLVLFSGEHP